MEFSEDELYAIWAAMQAMVNDIHAPQDMLTKERWAAAEVALTRLDAHVNAMVER